MGVADAHSRELTFSATERIETCYGPVPSPGSAKSPAPYDYFPTLNTAAFTQIYDPCGRIFTIEPTTPFN